MELATQIAVQTKYLARFRILISRAFRWHVLKTAKGRPSYAWPLTKSCGAISMVELVQSDLSTTPRKFRQRVSGDAA
jgi:hypothetical protein